MDLPRLNTDRPSSTSNAGASETNSLRRCWSRWLVTVEPVVFVYMFATYLYLVIFELYSFNEYGREELEEQDVNISLTGNVSTLNISRYGCLTTDYLDKHSSNNRSGDEAQKSTALLNLIVVGAGQLPSILTCLLLGPLSDTFGRKPTLIVILIGAGLQAALTSVIIHFQLSLYIFLVGSFAKAGSGGIAGLLTISHSYVADVSSRKWLTLRLGVVEACTCIAGMFSFVVGGVWVQLAKCDFRAPSYLLVGSIVAVLPYVIFCVPESLSNRKRSTRQAPKAGGLSPKALLKGFRIFFSPGPSRWKLWFTLLTMIVTILNTTGTVVIITLFLLHKPLAWHPYMIGVYLAASELVHGLSLLFLLPIMVALELPDAGIVLVGIGVSCVMDVCLGLVASTWEMFLVGILQGMDAVVIPALKALMSKMVEPGDQGALFSFITAAQVLASSIAVVIYALAYSKSLSAGFGAGTSFFLMAFLYMLSAPFMVAVLINHIRERRAQPRRSRIRIVTSPPPSSTGSRAIIPSINYTQSSQLDVASVEDVRETHRLLHSTTKAYTNYNALQYENST